MARKFGKTAVMGEHFYDYNYIINGVAAIGKTHLAHHLGIAATGSNEGTFIITCGREPEPTHIPNSPFYEHAKTFKEVMDIVKELTTNKAEYPNTKFIAIDSIDEIFRIAEDYVVAEWNNICKIDEKAKSISQAYKGFQKGENRVCDLIVKLLGNITDAGYKVIFIGHTKQKTSSDIYSGVSFDQITCSVDNKYYNVIKDKVNLVATCYYEKEIADIEEVKDAFSKKLKKKGNLISQKKVIVFADDDNAIDTKSHFAQIVPKIDFSVDGFVKAVEDAILAQKNGTTIKVETPTTSTSTPKVETPIIEETPIDTDETPFEETTETVDKSALMDDIRTRFKSAGDDTKKQIKAILKEKGSGKLDDSLEIDVLNEISAILDDEV